MLRPMFAALTALLTLAPPALAADHKPPMLGGFHDRKVDDPMVQKAAKEAVALLAGTTEIGKRPVVLRKVLAARSQVVAGMNYELTLDVTIGGDPSRAKVLVFEPLKGPAKLTRFTVDHLKKEP